MNLALAILLVVALFFYWHLCWSSSYKEREKLCDMTICYIKDESARQPLKDAAYFLFLSSGKWWLSPVMAILVPLSLLFTNQSRINDTDRDLQDGNGIKFQQIMESVITVSRKRNPIIFTVFTALNILLCFLVVCIKFAVGGLKKIPSPVEAVASTVNSLNLLKNKS